MSISVKGWSKFQHFKDRKPPWIKLYRDILDDMEWHRLDPEAAKLLVMLWLIASEDNGVLPDVETLAFRLRLSETKLSQLLNKLSHWLVYDDISLISGRYQADTAADIDNSVADIKSAPRERDRDRGETEGDITKSPPPGRNGKKKSKTQFPAEFELTADLAGYVEKHIPDADPLQLFESFKGKAQAKGWEYVSWPQAFQEFVRNSAPNSGHFASGQYPRKRKHINVDPELENQPWR